MNSFGYGNKVYQASTLGEAMAIIESNRELEEAERRHKLLADKNHGHDFDPCRKVCWDCGKDMDEYRMQVWQSRSNGADIRLCLGPDLELMPREV